MSAIAYDITEPSQVSSHVMEVLSAEGNLPICKACGMQYGLQMDSCIICDDPRQAVPASGQSWTTLNELSTSRRNTILVDKEDDRVKFIGTEPGFGINQTPILIETSEGSFIWDCAAFISTALVEHLNSKLRSPLRGIAISHPHFFATSLTWSRLLRVPLYLNDHDKEWYARRGEIRDGQDKVIWWAQEKELATGVRLIQCGGHFAGSSVLLWDRLQEPTPAESSTKRTLVSGLLLVSDTVMVQPTQHGFTFMWSYPNMIPLGPQDVIAIHKRLAHLPFSQATSAWPNRFIRENVKAVFNTSIQGHLRAMGWDWDVKAGILAPSSALSEAPQDVDQEANDLDTSFALPSVRSFGGPSLAFSTLMG